MNAEKKGKAALPSFHSEDLYGYVSPEWHPFRSQSQIDATDSEKDIEPTPKYTNEKKLSAFDTRLRRKSRILDNRKEEQLDSDGPSQSLTGCILFNWNMNRSHVKRLNVITDTEPNVIMLLPTSKLSWLVHLIPLFINL